MDITFDISPEEMPVFLAETDEQVQILDEGLVRLEREQRDADLLQAIFRAAHTLKGSAGMIGHKRMVEITHALEAVLDGLRKDSLALTSPLVDQCLKSLDVIKVLRDEVATGVQSDVETGSVVSGLQQYLSAGPSAAAPQPVAAAATAGGPTIAIRADVAPGSVTSAARALQVLLALQALGDVVSISPTMEQIETAAPVSKVTAQLGTTRSVEEIRRALLDISDIERVTIGGEEYTPSSGPAEPPAPQAEEPVRLGEYLVGNGLINALQLSAALNYQKDHPGTLLGSALVKIGAIAQQALDETIARLMNQMRSALTVAQAAPEKARARAGDKTVRVSVERLDSLMNLVGELITDRNRLYRVRADLEEQIRSYDNTENLVQTVTHIGRITDQLQEEVMRIRMLPVADVFNKYPRMVRDLARHAGKEVDLVVRGEDTELDRSVIEKISDPLIHLLRNSVDHGVESPAERRAAGKPERGTITLTARHENGQIILTVEDDGHGIDTRKVKSSAVRKGLITEADAAALSEEEAVELIFKAGLSTAAVVSDISGRGVGMDIVRNNIEQLNGTVLIDSWPGEGSRFQIVLPLTLAIVPTLLVRVGPCTFAIPLVTVTETLRVDVHEIRAVKNKPIILLRNNVLPLLRLGDAFRLGGNGRSGSFDYVVAVRSGKSQLGLVVDSFLGEQELTVKSLGILTGKSAGISGAAILGDGQVTLIVDVQALFRLAGLHQLGNAAENADAAPAEERTS